MPTSIPGPVEPGLEPSSVPIAGALRLVSGIIVTEAPSGRVTVRFDPHRVEGADGRGVELADVGSSGAFDGTVAKFVAVRQYGAPPLTFVPAGQSEPAGRRHIAFQIGDALVDGGLEVSWASGKGVGPQEISYLVVGAVGG